MKRFEIITEADARVLEIGETVALRPGGHIKPLAADTLREMGYQDVATMAGGFRAWIDAGGEIDG